MKDTITTSSSIHADLSQVSLEEALKHCTPEWYKEKNLILICSPQDAVIAGRLAEKYSIRQVVVTQLFTDQWLLVNDVYSYHSEGA
jgi:hypothetical protein